MAFLAIAWGSKKKISKKGLRKKCRRWVRWNPDEIQLNIGNVGLIKYADEPCIQSGKLLID